MQKRPPMRRARASRKAMAARAPRRANWRARAASRPKPRAKPRATPMKRARRARATPMPRARCRRSARAKLAEAEKTKAAFEKANNIILQQDNNDIDSLRLAALAGTSTPVTAAPQPAMGGASPMSAELAQIDAAIASAAARLGPNHPQMQEIGRAHV